jgi:hypothetical protein
MSTCDKKNAKKRFRRVNRGARYQLRPLLVPLDERLLLSTFTVTSAADNSAIGTLRWAVAEANSGTGTSTINFRLGTAPATITLTQGELELGRTSGSITIDGPGAKLLTVSGDNISRVFGVYQGVTASISGMTIAGGAEGKGYSGGGVYNGGTTTLTGCTISGNSAYGGGGVANFGVATLISCTISGNTASFGTDGGGLDNTGTMTLTGCAISDNSAWTDGGGLRNIGTTTVTDSTINGNSAGEGGGGVINGAYNSRTGSIALSSCTISGNKAVDFGGGLYNWGSTMTLAACTISDNQGTGLGNAATANLTDCTISGNAPGVTNDSGTANLTACTISGNAGGGVLATYGDVTLTDSIVAGNYNVGTPFDIGGVVTGSYNVIGGAASFGSTQGIFGTGNILLTSANGLGLDPLAFNGGATQTMALLSGSVAIGAGTPVAGVTADQRGQPLDSPLPDIGAYQTQPGQAGIPVTTFTVTSTADTGGAGTLRWAIEQANQQVGNTTINFNLGSAPTTISLSGQDLELERASGSIAIDGPGAARLTISGDESSRVFAVDQGVTATFSGLTITGGAAGSHGRGGGIYSAGTTKLTDCTLSGNSADLGGGEYSAQGNTKLIGCTIADNVASQGAGLESGSHASSNATLALVDSTITGNFASDFGGGICNYGMILNLTACTISGNSAAAVGGGLYAGNGTVKLTDTIIAGNLGDGDLASDIFGTVGGSYNLVGTGGAGGLANGVSGNIVLASLAGLDLAPLADNGGPTQTMALLEGSPAIGAGTPAAGLSTDQRGQPLDSPHPDIGAYQAQQGKGGNSVAALLVTSTADNSGVGTLRWAIAQANSSKSASKIEIELGTASATITLTQGTLELKNTTVPTTIYDGPGDGPVTVSGNQNGRVFENDANVTTSISGLTITGGASNFTNYYGNGVRNSGTLTLVDCIISGNSTSAFGGSGLDNGGNATLIACTISGNSGAQAGQVRNTGTLTLASCTIAEGNGDGVDNVVGTATVFGCTITGNAGAGFYNRTAATLTDCTIAGNGLGLDSGNEFSYSATTIITACTISGNNRGIYVGGGSAILTDSIVAGNQSSGVASDIDSPSQGVSGSFNLIGTGGAAGLSAVTHNIVLTTVAGLGLGPLADNGGPTQTMALVPGSPAIDAGTDVLTVKADERGQPLDTPNPDIGAYQTQLGTTSSSQSVFVVTSTADNDSDGTLRWAIAQVSIARVATTIEFELGPSAALITLSQGVLEFPNTAEPTSIDDAPGEGTVTISGNNATRVFQVDQGVTASFNGLTITGGSTSASGGGLYNAGTTTLTDCTVAGNSSLSTASDTGGAGVFNGILGVLTVDDCTVSHNTAGWDGGGLFNFGTLTVTGSTFSGNTAAGNGGALFDAPSASMTMTGSMISGNSASSNGGGAVVQGTATLVECIVSGNSAATTGGGLFAYSPSFSLSYSTLNGNSAPLGGGLYNARTATLTNCTISGNSASDGGGVENFGPAVVVACTISGNTASQGGGFYNYGIPSYASTAELTDTIVAANTDGAGDLSDIAGNQAQNVSGSHNLIGAGGSGGLSNGIDGNIVLTPEYAPDLTPLADNGGPTETIALLPDSPAVGAGVAVSGVTTDQRGEPLHFPMPDIGAFQTQTGPAPSALFIVTSALDDGSDGTLRWAVAQANSATTPSAIELELGASPTTITLTQGQLELTNASASIAIYNGPGEGEVTISGNEASRVFQVDSRVTASLSGLTITGGATSGNGGGLYNFEGTLSLTDCTISGNSGQNGGGLNNFGSATLTDCTLSGNSATRGGGLFSFPYSPAGPVTLSMANCTVSGNSAYLGGGLYTYNGTATVSACTISGNTAQSGGGLFNTGTLVLTDSTISGNTASTGGGLFNAAPGGGRYNLGDATLTFCTIADNAASAFGGGIYDDGSAYLADTIVARNTIIGAFASDIDVDTSGTLTGEFDLIGIGIGGSGDIEGGTDGNIVLTSLDELGLASLADNGGPTPTMELLPGSAAIGTGIRVTGITTDQRGEPLDTPQPDIGAFQTQPGESTVSTFIVTSALDDSSTGTLRWAIAQANIATTASSVEIELGSAPATITLTQGPLVLANTSNSVAVYDGPGQGLVTISGNEASGVFQVNQGVTASLTGVTITAGSTSGVGGGLVDEGTTTLTDCTISGNTSTSPNSFSGGGAFFIGRTGILYLDQCTISDNSASQDGGAVFNYGQTTLVDCTISDNSAGALGGGFFNSYPDSSITLTGCTISGNSAARGGGLYNDDHVTLTNCTISGDTAKYGGGIENYGTVNLTACTISANSAAQAGGGLYNFSASSYQSTISLTDTIVAGNTGAGGNADDIGGNQSGNVTGSYNLIGIGGSGGIVNDANGDIVLTNLSFLGLAPLGDNGGPTQTMALMADSVAINEGTAAGITVDQRGQPVNVPEPDIGAFQTQTGQLPTFIFRVTSDLDDGSSGTLRWAIVQANSVRNASNIVLELGISASTITLSQGQFELENTTNLISIYDGSGQGPVTISGADNGRVVQIDQGVSASLTGLTITGGNTSGNGGGLYNEGTASLTDCIIESNTSTSSAHDTGGGGIFNSANSQLTLDACTLAGNSSSRDGGGLFNQGTATLAACTVDSNSVSVNGGGLFNDASAAITVTGTTISGNFASGAGSGLNNDGTAALVDCTISGDTGAFAGGGISQYDPGSISLTNCTLSGNSGRYGGGLEIAGTANVMACTISGNSAAVGGGIYNYGTRSYSSTVSLMDTIVAGNTGSDGAADDIGGDQANGVAGSFDLIGPGGSGGIVPGVSGNIVLADLDELRLAPLGDYGGPGQTMALLPGSVALDTGTAASGVTTDERGDPLDVSPDIGAFQSHGFTLVPVAGSTTQSTLPGDLFANPLAVVVTANDPLEPVAGGAVIFTVNPGVAGAAASLSGMAAMIGVDGTAQVGAIANAMNGPYTATASANGALAPVDFELFNVSSTQFSGLLDQSITYGTSTVTVSGLLSGGAPAIPGETIAVTLAGTTATADIGSDGAFSIALIAADLTVSATPYTITCAYMTDGYFASASATTTLSVTAATPTLSVENAGGTFDGLSIAPDASILGVDGISLASLEGSTLSIAYYSGSYDSIAQLSGLTPLRTAPIDAGPYAALASFPGSPDYMGAVAIADFTITRATPIVSIIDAGGLYDGSAFTASATVAGVNAGVDTSPATELEGVPLTILYYSGTFVTAGQLVGLTPLAGAPSHAGSYTVLASFAGSSNYLGTTGLAALTITKGVPQVTWSSSGSIVYGTPLSSAMLDAHADVPGSFAYDEPPGTIVGTGSGEVLAVVFTPTDSADYITATAATAINVVRATPTISVSAPGGTYSGEPALASVRINVSQGAIEESAIGNLESVAATMAYFQGSNLAGQRPSSTPPIAPGTYTVVATFPGSADFAPAVSAPVTFTITPAITSIAVSASTSSPVVGQSVTFVATLKAPGGPPMGFIEFYDAGTSVGVAPIDSSGTATLALANLTVGAHSITANYAGNGNLRSATSTSQSDSVAQDATELVLIPQGKFNKKKLISVSLTAEVEPVAPGLGMPTGTVTFMLKKKVLGTATLADSTTTLRLAGRSILNKSVAIIYSGDPSFLPSMTAPIVRQSLLKSSARNGAAKRSRDVVQTRRH